MKIFKIKEAVINIEKNTLVKFGLHCKCCNKYNVVGFSVFNHKKKRHFQHFTAAQFKNEKVCCENLFIYEYDQGHHYVRVGKKYEFHNRHTFKKEDCFGKEIKIKNFEKVELFISSTSLEDVFTLSEKETGAYLFELEDVLELGKDEIKKQILDKMKRYEITEAKILNSISSYQERIKKEKEKRAKKELL